MLLPPVSRANAEAEHEYRRLLYVAMTRAAQRLIICGADGLKKRPQDCWYDLIRNALDASLVAEGEGDEKVLLYRKGTREEAAAPAATQRLKAPSANSRIGYGKWFLLTRRGSRRLRLLLSKTTALFFPRSPVRRRRAKKRCGAAALCIG